MPSRLASCGTAWTRCDNGGTIPDPSPRCRWLGLREALSVFVSRELTYQSSGHIKPLHWHVACRLAIEGGFHPDEITPRPPLVVSRRDGLPALEFQQSAGGTGERTVLGALKTKAVDVVVSKEGIGPVLAVSIKGTLNAFRNLTNRMEEAVGDCTNLHIAYPALVYGFLHVMRATKAGRAVSPNDVAVERGGQICEAILRYHDVLARLAGRADLRNESSRYEAVALALVQPDGRSAGRLLPGFPPADSPLLLEDFFARIYRQYDQRFVYSAPALQSVTRRLEWHRQSSVLRDCRAAEYRPRLAGGT